MSEGKPLVLVWDEIKSLADALVEQIKQSANPIAYDGVVAVSNGGLVPACLVAKGLGIKVIDTVDARAFAPDDRRLDFPYITKESLQKMKTYRDKAVLIVDDLADKGETLCLVYKEALQHASHVHTAVLIRKDHAMFVPNFYLPWPAEQNKEWITFPWEA